MKQTLVLALVVFALVPAAGVASVCPMRFIFELARNLAPGQAVRGDGGQSSVETPEVFPPDTRAWAVSPDARDQAIESFLRHFGTDELRGLYLVGSGGAVTAFVAFVHGTRSHREDIARVRAELRATFGLVPVEVYGRVTGCSDCPLRSADVPAPSDDPAMPYAGALGCVLSVEDQDNHQSVLLWASDRR